MSARDIVWGNFQNQSTKPPTLGANMKEIINKKPLSVSSNSKMTI